MNRICNNYLYSISIWYVNNQSIQGVMQRILYAITRYFRQET